MRITPSPPNNQRDAGDLAQADISAAQLGEIIMKSGMSNYAAAAGASGSGYNPGGPMGIGLNPGIAGGQSATPNDIAALLAAILKTQARSSSKFRIYPFAVAAGQLQQILPENPLRTSLVISGASTDTVLVLLDQGSTTPQPAQISDTKRGVPLQLSDTNLTFFVDFVVAPTNPITMIGTTANVTGVILEGVQQ